MNHLYIGLHHRHPLRRVPSPSLYSEWNSHLNKLPLESSLSSLYFEILILINCLSEFSILSEILIWINCLSAFLLSGVVFFLFATISHIFFEVAIRFSTPVLPLFWPMHIQVLYMQPLKDANIQILATSHKSGNPQKSQQLSKNIAASKKK